MMQYIRIVVDNFREGTTMGKYRKAFQAELWMLHNLRKRFNKLRADKNALRYPSSVMKDHEGIARCNAGKMTSKKLHMNPWQYHV